MRKLDAYTVADRVETRHQGARMPVRKVSALFFAVLLATTACSLEPKFVQLSFEGQLTDVATGDPVVGATVSLVEALNSTPGAFLVTGTTNAEGRYSLTYAECADVPFIVAEATGYRTVGVSVSCAEDAQNLNIELTAETAP